MAALALAPIDVLERSWDLLADRPGYQMLRAPEYGLVMVRGRIGGSGSPFNLGELTLTRCSVVLEQGAVGHAYVAGRKLRHAELAAVFDALMQDGDVCDALEASLIRPLEAAREAMREQQARTTAATRVEFFTVVRGDG